MRRLIVCLGLVCMGLVVSLKADRRIGVVSDVTFHVLITNPILILTLGIGLTYLGFGPFSLKKNPTAGTSVAVVGLLLRMAGSLLLVWDGFLWLFVPALPSATIRAVAAHLASKGQASA